MKKLLIILMMGNLYADTIVYKSGSKNRTIENVEYIKAGNGKVYFKAHGGEVSRDCSKVVTFTDNVGNPIDYDCSVVIDEPQIKGKTKLDNSHKHFIEAGEKLIKFRSKYYRGFSISIIGQGLLFMGAINSETAPIIAGGVASLLGGIMMLISFDSVGEAGEDLIDAGERLEAEQPKKDE